MRAPTRGRIAARTVGTRGPPSRSPTAPRRSGPSSRSPRRADHVRRDLARGRLQERERRRHLAEAGPKSAGHAKMSFDCRVTRMTADPSNPRELSMPGLRWTVSCASRDGGETLGGREPAPSIKLADRPHLKSRIVSDTEIEGTDGQPCALCMSSAAPGTVFLAARMGVFRSADHGATWGGHGDRALLAALTYSRDVCVSPHNPNTPSSPASAPPRAARTARSTGATTSAARGSVWTAG